jgi:hypothetical protein
MWIKGTAASPKKPLRAVVAWLLGRKGWTRRNSGAAATLASQASTLG